MTSEFDQMLQKYADLAVKVGLNLQAGQRLLITEPLYSSGVLIHTAPLIRRIATSAYRAGAKFVDVMWSDDQLQLIRFQHAPRDSFSEYPTWLSNGMLEYVKRGDAVLSVFANDPDLLRDQDPGLVGTAQQTSWHHIHPAMEYITRNATNWLAISAAASGWAAKVFPGVPQPEQETTLWNTIFEVCRVNQVDPISAWQDHIKELVTRSDYLNRKQYMALKYTAPGTDLTIGLPRGHIWKSGHLTSENGIAFTANLPTEEVFTLPHKDKADGVVKASRPLSYGGTLVENFSLNFAGGRVVSVTADKGEAVLRELIETDEGAARLGEVALVPHSSPISQSGLLFYNTLFDENAASHVALGAAYKFSVQGGSTMSDDEFAAIGGNSSLVHVDFMIGSAELDIDGLAEDGTAEPIMRGGEWAFGDRIGKG